MLQWTLEEAQQSWLGSAAFHFGCGSGEESTWQVAAYSVDGCCPLPPCARLGEALYELHACLHCPMLAHCQP